MIIVAQVDRFGEERDRALGKVHGAAGRRREQVAGAAERVAHALLMDRRGKSRSVRRVAIVGENAGPVFTDDSLKDFGTAL